MAVPEGTLSDAFRGLLLEFYGPLLGWTEMRSLRRADRLTVGVGGSAYINLRERPHAALAYDYEHFGVLLSSGEDLRALWDELDRRPEDVALEPLVQDDKGEGSFRFRYLLPFSVEAQFYASLL